MSSSDDYHCQPIYSSSNLQSFVNSTFSDSHISMQEMNNNSATESVHNTDPLVTVNSTGYNDNSEILCISDESSSVILPNLANFQSEHLLDFDYTGRADKHHCDKEIFEFSAVSTSFDIEVIDVNSLEVGAEVIVSTYDEDSSKLDSLSSCLSDSDICGNKPVETRFRYGKRKNCDRYSYFPKRRKNSFCFSRSSNIPRISDKGQRSSKPNCGLFLQSSKYPKRKLIDKDNSLKKFASIQKYVTDKILSYSSAVFSANKINMYINMCRNEKRNLCSKEMSNSDIYIYEQNFSSYFFNSSGNAVVYSADSSNMTEINNTVESLVAVNSTDYCNDANLSYTLDESPFDTSPSVDLTFSFIAEDGNPIDAGILEVGAEVVISTCEEDEISLPLLSFPNTQNRCNNEKCGDLSTNPYELNAQNIPESQMLGKWYAYLLYRISRKRSSIKTSQRILNKYLKWLRLRSHFRNSSCLYGKDLKLCDGQLIATSQVKNCICKGKSLVTSAVSHKIEGSHLKEKILLNEESEGNSLRNNVGNNRELNGCDDWLSEQNDENNSNSDEWPSPGSHKSDADDPRELDALELLDTDTDIEDFEDEWESNGYGTDSERIDSDDSLMGFIRNDSDISQSEESGSNGYGTASDRIDSEYSSWGSIRNGSDGIASNDNTSTDFEDSSDILQYVNSSTEESFDDESESDGFWKF